jgi:hypothetical protein
MTFTDPTGLTAKLGNYDESDPKTIQSMDKPWCVDANGHGSEVCDEVNKQYGEALFNGDPEAQCYKQLIGVLCPKQLVCSND